MDMSNSYWFSTVIGMPPMGRGGGAMPPMRPPMMRPPTGGRGGPF